MSTPTPRTDAEECNAFIGVSEHDSGDVQDAYTFARTLETELTTALARVEELEARAKEREKIEQFVSNHNTQLIRQLSEAQAQLASANRQIERDTECIERIRNHGMNLEAQLASAREDSTILNWLERYAFVNRDGESELHFVFIGSLRSRIKLSMGHPGHLAETPAGGETGKASTVEWKPKIGDWFLIKTSICGFGNENGCTQENPCADCLEQSNRFVITAEHAGEYFFFGGGFCNRDGGCLLDETYSYILTTKPKDAKHHFKAGEGGCVHVSECIPLPPPPQGKETK